MHGKTMREALQEARNYRDPTNEGGPGSGPQKGGKKQSSADIKKAYGILNDPRYKQGNYSGAAKAIDKLSPGLSNHPDVKNAMKRANEESQITEKKAEFLRLDFKNKNEVEKLEGWMYKFISQVNAPYDSVVFNKHRLDGFSVEFEGMDDADALMTKLKRAGFRFKVDMRENLDLPATGDTTTSNASQEVETVELDEAAFSQAQIDTLKQKYSGLSGSEKNGIQMDKLAKIMKRYPSGHLNQLAKLDIPMVSKVAKAMTEGGPGSGPQKGGGSSGDGRGDYKKSSKDALALKKYKSKFSHLKNDPLKIPGASKHMPADKSKRVSMKKTPRKFGGDYYDQEDREELAHRVKFHHLGGKSFAGKAPDWQLKKYGITDDGKLKTGWKPDDQLKG